MSISKRIVDRVSPRITDMAPHVTTSAMHRALDQAIKGLGPLPGAAKAADKQLSEHGGDVAKAIHDIIENNVRLAAGEGFLTNLGGLVTMTVTVPANVTGLAVIQCRMTASIAHLRGYDLADPRARNAILACLLGEEQLLKLIKDKSLPGTPMALATAPVHDPHLDQIVAAEVVRELLSKVAGKRLATMAGRRIPVVGGLVGASADGFSTWRIGRYVERELLPRNRR